jgi:hypothetical protein
MYLNLAELPCTKIDFCQRFVYILAAFGAVSFLAIRIQGIKQRSASAAETRA